MRTLTDTIGDVLNTSGLLDTVKSASLHGLLLIGRFAWTMKSRGGILAQYLSLNGISKEKGVLYGNIQLTSREQLRSAFEIADADGDGKLSYIEAVDAVQALAIGSESDELLFLSPSLTPSVTFFELTLLCAHLHDCQSDDIFLRCLTSICEESHACWCESLVQNYSESLFSTLKEQLRPHHNSCQFLALWKNHNIELDKGQNEMIMLPSCCSPALFILFRHLNQDISSDVLSIDTVQEWSTAYNDNNEGKSSVCLANFVVSKILHMAAVSLTEVYAKLCANFLESRTNKIHDDVNSCGSIEENSVLQVLMDVSVLEEFFERNQISAEDLQKCRRKWVSYLDPVNAHLMLPILKETSIISSSNSFLIFPERFNQITKLHQNYHTSSKLKPDSDAIFEGVFCLSQSNRFALLPLAVSTSSSLNDCSHMDREKRMLSTNNSIRIESTGDKGFGNNFISSIFGK